MSRKQVVLKKKKRHGLDPRFNAEISEFKPHQFHENYQFLDDMRKQENRVIRREVRSIKKKTKGEGNEMMQRLKDIASKNKGDLKQSKRAKKILKAKIDLSRKNREEGIHMTQAQFKNNIAAATKAIKKKRRKF